MPTKSSDSPFNGSFLDPTINGWIGHHRAANQAWHGLACEIIGHFVHTMRGLAIPEPELDERIRNGILLYIRGFSNLQGAVVLAERGLTGEARTLARNCFETAFYLGALANKPSFLEQLDKNERRNKRILAECLLSDKDTKSGLDLGAQESLKAFLANPENNIDKDGKIYVESVAASAQLTPFYELYYRSLSNDGTHPTLSTLLRHFDEAGQGSGAVLRYGPDAPDVEETLCCWCVVGIVMLEIAVSFLPLKIERQNFEKMTTKYKLFLADVEGRS